MKFKAIIIASLLAIVIAAPIVDALACDDCGDIISVRAMQQGQTRGADHSNVNVLSADAACPAQQETGAAQHLCSVCSNIAAAMGNAYWGTPSMISRMNPLPKLIALSDPSYSITKPPQN